MAHPAREVFEEPVLAGPWAGLSPYYRIELREYEPFDWPLPLRTLFGEYGAEILGDIVNTAPRFYPFTRWGGAIRTVQGIYLARATPGLYGIIHRALGLQETGGGVAENPRASTHDDYVEARRLSHERYYFARNPTLVKVAKEHYGYSCQVCDFDFEVHYGELGKHYIECHHKDPLSERPEEEHFEGTATGLDDVAVVCSNCHRMLHRQRPALSIDALRALMLRMAPVISPGG